MQPVERIVINELISDGIIPDTGLCDINENLLSSYIVKYGKLFNKSGKGLLRKNEIRFARRLAGLTLLKLNFERNIKFHQIDAGIVYMIENPVYNNHYKIGMTIDLNSRLDSYQTYDPYKSFKVLKYDFVLNRSHFERRILSHPNITNESGEWVLRENAIEIFELICFRNGKESIG